MVASDYIRFSYKGPSMNPTLKAGDGLRVVPYGNRRISVGDVVVFQAPETRGHVSHRVISVDHRGVRTRGDNNSNRDSWILRPDDITGRVISAHRGTKSIPIHGGKRGMVCARSIRLIKRADLTISRIFHPVYRRLAASGIFRRVLPRGTEPRVLCFSRGKGIEMQVLLGRWVIGRRRPGEQWQVRRPFRFFVDKRSLPD